MLDTMAVRVAFHYDPSRKGLGQILGDLEMDVMRSVWKHGESSVREIQGWINRDVAYSSIITVANRLARKGLLAREKRGKTYHYAPRLNRKELLDLAARRVLSRVSDIAPPATVVHLLGSVIGDDPEALAALEEVIKKRRKARGRK